MMMTLGSLLTKMSKTGYINHGERFAHISLSFLLRQPTGDLVDGIPQRPAARHAGRGAGDPGAHDGTAGEDAAYDECCRQVAREMLALVSRVTG